MDPTAGASVVSGMLALAILLGSRGLRDFDSALAPYAIASVFLVFGVARRYLVWISRPGARRLFAKGNAALFSARNFRRAPTALPRMAATYLGLQKFLGARSRGRWIAHQLMFWGCLLAAAITFPLTWGWLTFTANTGSGPGYTMNVWGFGLIHFDALSAVGWLAFHGLDIAAVLVIPGASYFLWRRFTDRAATTGQRFAYDFIPLVALITISVTGLLLTFSSAVLHGGGYQFLALIHMAAVVLTLLYLPFGKFFHIVARPAAVGMQLVKYTDESAVAACVKCGEPIEAGGYLANLRATMRDLDLGFDGWVRTCPRCKRRERGRAYLSDVKRGF